MNDDVLQFMFRWGLDVRSYLQQLFARCVEELESENETTRSEASKRMDVVLDWLHPPLPPLSVEERNRRASSALADESLSPDQRAIAARRALRATGRHQGRTRDETSQHAIDALTLHDATGLSWRRIAVLLRGCTHKRPNRELSCESCGESIRQAAFRLEKFLKSTGFDRTFAKENPLDQETQKRLLELWRSHHGN